MNIQFSKYIDNYLQILKSIESFEGIKSIITDGKLNVRYCDFTIDDIKLKSYCNIFDIKNINLVDKSKKIESKNIVLEGKYNIISLSNLQKGKFEIKSVGNTLEKDIKKIKIINKIDKMFSVIENNVKEVNEYNKNIKTNLDFLYFDKKSTNNKKLMIENISPSLKTIYLKNISKDIVINYNTNNIKIILENVNAKVILLNNSELTSFNCIKEKSKNKEQFGNSLKNSCTNKGQSIIILIAIYFLFTMLTKKQVIKLNI